MNPPVLDPHGHQYPERRHGPRRDDDIPPEVALGFVRWVKLLALHKGKVTAFVALVGTCSGYIVGCAGRLHDLDAVKADVSAQRGELTAVKSEVASVRSGQKLQRYITCLSVPSTAPAEALRLCRQIIEEGP